MHLDLIGSFQMAFTLMGMWCLNTPRFIRWGCIFGLAAQPFWFIIAFRSGEIGMVVTTSIITLLWLKGFHNFWIKPKFKLY